MTDRSLEDDETLQGEIFRVSGPLIIAVRMSGSFVNEIVRVGPKRLVGEVIRLEHPDQAFLQCYEDTSGLKQGDLVYRTKMPLSVELGPGLLESIVDGIQRPLASIFNGAAKQSPFIPLGVEVPSLDPAKRFLFTPNKGKDAFRPGMILSGGTILGSVWENELLPRHSIMAPPDVCGEIVSVYSEDLTGTDGKEEISIHEPIMRVKQEGSGEIVDVSLSHKWPVRKPRPVAEKLPGKEALITGQRVLDVLFPSVLGGTCAIPGAFGCGKTCISQALSKYSNTSAIVYVGCGERGNEMAEVLADFPELTTTTPDGKEVGIMKRTCLVANTSNMPVAAREASIYTGITIAEYFRDQGLHVAMMADSTSRWAEALREISGRLGEMPADAGYPAYLGARLARFYERAGLARCLGSPSREGSVTVVGAVSPPGGDFSDPVTSATLGIVQVFWGLDKKLAQRKHFPSVNWNISYSKYMRVLGPFFDNLALSSQQKMLEGSSAASASVGGAATAQADAMSFSTLREIARDVLQQEKDLSEIVQLVGRDSLSEDQKVVLETAKILREDFLQQNAFSAHDYNCPLEKSIGMLRVIVTLYKKMLKAVTGSDTLGSTAAAVAGAKTVTWNVIRGTQIRVIARVTDMKFLDPRTSPAEMRSYFSGIIEDIAASFDALMDSV